MVASGVGEKRRRPNTVRSRRLGVQIKLTDDPGDRKPGISFDPNARVGPHATFASRHRHPFAVNLCACRLSPIPRLASQLQQPKMVLLKDVQCDGPPSSMKS
jgi:hypothetical protein